VPDENTKQTTAQAPLPALRRRQKVVTLIEMAQDRLRNLLLPGPSHGKNRVRRELEALSLALEEMGYPPAAYDDTLRAYRAERHRPMAIDVDAPDTTAELAPGDLAISTYRRHRGRCYRITHVENGVIWGRRVSKFTGRAMEGEAKIKWPLTKIAETTQGRSEAP
jgi:hypothetical protein